VCGCADRKVLGAHSWLREAGGRIGNGRLRWQLKGIRYVRAKALKCSSMYKEMGDATRPTV
jgi:hypothetical protein